MPLFDASSMIYAWDNYPIDQFPGLWEWLATQLAAKKLIMPDVAFGETNSKLPECGKWLQENQIELIKINNQILQHAIRIKRLLEIVNDNYHPKGVGENDILIIATAVHFKVELISNEGRQNHLPEIRSKMRIPSVCNLKEINVSCSNFIDYLKQTGVTFR